MEIQDKTYVEIKYALTLGSGELVDQSPPDSPLGFVFGASQIIPGLEKKLQGMSAGQAAKLVVEPAEGYGERNEEMVQTVPRKHFPEEMEIKPGQVFQANSPGGPATLRVIGVTDEEIKADFNHPLAGEQLTFDIEVISVRQATDEELKALDGHGCGSGCDCS